MRQHPPAQVGEVVSKMLDREPRRWKIVEHVREKFTCRDCEAITEPPAPSRPIPRGLAGPSLLAMVLVSKFLLHLPLNRQSDAYRREGVDIDESTLADWLGSTVAGLDPVIQALRSYVLSAERIHADDTTVPVLAKLKTVTGRIWTYVRDDRPFGGKDPPAAMFYYSRNRAGDHPHEHLAGYAGIMRADAFSGFNGLYDAKRRPAPITEARGTGSPRASTSQPDHSQVMARSARGEGLSDTVAGRCELVKIDFDRALTLSCCAGRQLPLPSQRTSWCRKNQLSKSPECRGRC
jgi:transposase